MIRDVIEFQNFACLGEFPLNSKLYIYRCWGVKNEDYGAGYGKAMIYFWVILVSKLFFLGYSGLQLD